jgi:hypothetical protein
MGGYVSINVSREELNYTLNGGYSLDSKRYLQGKEIEDFVSFGYDFSCYMFI